LDIFTFGKEWAVGETELQLKDGSKVAVIGGGPAGSFFSYFLIEMAERAGLEIDVEIFEPRDFSCPAPTGCNMCGGIISETLVQNLAAEGINLPPTVVQRGIESYMLHMDVGSVRIEPPIDEKRIGAVYRGIGPRDIKERKWDSFDLHLEQLAAERGAKVTRGRVDRVTMENGRPTVAIKGGEPQEVDLLVVAVGVNSPTLKLFKELDIGYKPPKTTKTFIREYFLGEKVIAEKLGDSMHVFLLNIPRLEFAAIIPKGDYASVCLLGEAIDKKLVDAFLSSPQVRNCMPDSWSPEPSSCQCSPKISVEGAIHPYADRLVFVGDCGVTRLYKDGIGAAYRTAKACATTAVFEGISSTDFEQHYWPICRGIRQDNAIGKATFSATRVIQALKFARRALLNMTAKEQTNPDRSKDMSHVLWDMFTGSAPYKDIFVRALHPRFISRLGWELLASVLPHNRQDHLH
jgi:flavin-dependent dehydrogenase